MKLSKKGVLKFVLGMFVFIPLILIADFAIEELQNNQNSFQTFPVNEVTTSFGESKLISDIESEVILIDFWFAGCKPCLHEMAFFPELLDKYKDRLTIISYSIDPVNRTQELLLSENGVWSFLDASNSNWIFSNTSLSGENSIVNSMNITYYPTYFIINNKTEVLFQPKSGIYGVEKILSGNFAIGLTLKKYLASFQPSKFYISIFLYLILVAFFFLTMFIKNKFLKK
jgi:thiol-disulfide isomerase/thioredoxin